MQQLVTGIDMPQLPVDGLRQRLRDDVPKAGLNARIGGRPLRDVAREIVELARTGLARRARLTGNVGVYQLRGCPSYASLTKPNRWFCSEDDARAAGFRKAYNCRIKLTP